MINLASELNPSPTWYIKKRNGTYHDLAQMGIEILDHSGLDLPAVRMQSDTVPQSHGEIDHGFTYQARRFNLRALIRCHDNASFYTKRRQLIRMLQPGRYEDALGVMLPNGRHVEIDFRCNGNILDGGRYAGNRGRGQVAGIPCKASNPLFRSPQLIELSSNGSVGSDTATIPIQYAGDVAARPRIIISGNINDFVIRNLSTGHKLDFTGLLTLPFSNFTVDLRPQTFIITDGFGNRADGSLTEDSNLAEFRLAADGDILAVDLNDDPTLVSTGLNEIELTNVVGGTWGYRIQYHDLFVGL